MTPGLLNNIPQIGFWHRRILSNSFPELMNVENQNSTVINGIQESESVGTGFE